MANIDDSADLEMMKEHDEELGEVLDGACVVASSFILAIEARDDHIDPSAGIVHFLFEPRPFPMVSGSPVDGEESELSVGFFVVRV